ncbi:MAG TPA: GGDEF domain-containing protein [Mycobacterium sp.]|nr:GGDEF domain-containing protein [Mycobacterium sp.]HPZ94376.1 GGDEF domain-containing protein [Mycobacterium sp.]HQE15210.1 GGDEF domain-containing protein [Mycobacterium sp.]
MVEPAPPTPKASYQGWVPRLTSRVFLDLQILMMGFGLTIGVVFPFAVVLLGVPSEDVLRPAFFAATILAGLLVGVINTTLVQLVVGVRLQALAAGMRRVETSMREATETGNWASCDPASCRVPVDSTDELGEAADSFNHLVDSLAASHRVTDGISALGEALAAHLELAPLADAALNELTMRTGIDGAALLVVNSGRVELIGSLGIRDASALADSDTVQNVITSQEPRVLHLPPGITMTGTVVDFVPAEVRVLPARYGVAVVGVLVIAAARPIGRESIAVVESALSGLAVALTNALSHQDLQRVAALDPLTSVYNRRFGIERLNDEIARSQRSGDSLGLLMLDLDHFKSVNDTYGHLVGDRVLQAAVGATRQVLRDGDVLVRYGGEEFLVILPGAGRRDLMDMAERIRRSISDTEIATGGHRLSITVSIGGAGLPDQSVRDSMGLIGIADQALYTAKATGRDRSVIA